MAQTSKINKEYGIVSVNKILPLNTSNGIEISSNINFDVILVDTITEKTTNSGVTIDSVLLKDNSVNTSIVLTDTINERTVGSGITIDSVLLKDNKVVTQTANIASADGLFINNIIVPQEIVLTYTFRNTVQDANIFIARSPVEVVAIKQAHATKSGSAGTINVIVRKCTGTQTPAAGLALHTNAFNLNSASVINTVVDGTLAALQSTRQLAVNNRICADFTGALTGINGGVIVCYLKRI